MTPKSVVTALLATGCACWLAGAAQSQQADFSRYTDCASCVAAGYGWSTTKRRCGGFSNTQCPGPDAAAAAAAATASAAPVVVQQLRDVWYEDTVHLLVSFCGGSYATVEKMAPYFRSLLFHRSCRVHFHVLADAASWCATKPNQRKAELTTADAAASPLLRAVPFRPLPAGQSRMSDRNVKRMRHHCRDMAQQLFRTEVTQRWAHVEVTFVPRAENDAWLKKAGDLQTNLAFPTSLPVWAAVGRAAAAVRAGTPLNLLHSAAAPAGRPVRLCGSGRTASCRSWTQ